MLFCWWDKNETRSGHAYTMLERWVLQRENHLAELNLNQASKRSESFKNIENIPEPAGSAYEPHSSFFYLHKLTVIDIFFRQKKYIHLNYEAKKSTVLQHLSKISLYDSSVFGTIIYRLAKEA